MHSSRNPRPRGFRGVAAAFSFNDISSWKRSFLTEALGAAQFEHNTGHADWWRNAVTGAHNHHLATVELGVLSLR